MNVELRPASEADQPLLFELYSSTREFELSQVPWPAEQKQAFLQMQFMAQAKSYAASHQHATQQMICVDGQPAGRLYLDRQADALHILDITIAPAARNAGIGSEVLRRILEEAERDGKAVRIYTEIFNPSQRLFERLGFRRESVDGFLVLLQRPMPGTAVPPAG